MAKFKVFLSSFPNQEKPFVVVEAEHVYDHPNRGGELRFTINADKAEKAVAVFPSGHWSYYIREPEPTA